MDKNQGVMSFQVNPYLLDHSWMEWQIPRDGGDVDSEGRLLIFSHWGRAFGELPCHWLTNKECDQVVIYTLLSCEEVGPYVEIFDEEVKSMYPHLTEVELESHRDREFLNGFNNLTMIQ